MMRMVYCSKCGKQNEDAVEFCVDCGASVVSLTHERKRDNRMNQKKDECFGLPGGGAIFGLFIGIIIIIVGLQQVLGFSIDVGPLAIIIIGLLFITGAIYSFTRRGN
jgi:uncharacterized membrane protein YvbJ